MNNLSDDRYDRLKFLFELSVQRRKDAEAAGETRRRSGLSGDDYLTETERQEFFDLARQLSGVRIVDGQILFRGRSWSPSDSEAALEQ